MPVIHIIDDEILKNDSTLVYVFIDGVFEGEFPSYENACQHLEKVLTDKGYNEIQIKKIMEEIIHQPYLKASPKFKKQIEDYKNKKEYMSIIPKEKLKQCEEVKQSEDVVTFDPFKK